MTYRVELFSYFSQETITVSVIALSASDAVDRAVNRYPSNTVEALSVEVAQ